MTGSERARELYEEGLIVPPLKAVEGGRENETFFAMLEANVRVPQQVASDVRALITGCRVLEAKLAEFLDRHAMADLDDLASAILEHSETAMRRAIAETIPEGTYHGMSSVDGREGPIEIHAHVQSRGGEILVDFTGTAPQRDYGINSTLVYTYIWSTFTIKAVCLPGLANNAGTFAPMEVTAPEGTLVNPTFPAPVKMKPVTGHYIPAAILDALGDVIAFDMGGTTAKICVIDDGRPERATEFEVARVYRFARGSGLPLRVPVTEMIEIGAGGGSIARVDETGLLKVGPDSAGSDPGPACYMRGGAEPTVTDADLVLGYLDPEFFLGGAMRLERERALDAIASRVAGPLRLDPLRAAAGIHDIVNNNMARAAKVHCFERGKDPRTYSLVAFGGAGPVHAWRLAEVLGIDRVIFPARAGVMSAFGFLVAAPSFELVQAHLAPLEDADFEPINTHLRRMEAQGRASLRAAGVAARGIAVAREVGLRYRGQKFEIEVPASRGTLRAPERRRLRGCVRGALPAAQSRHTGRDREPPGRDQRPASGRPRDRR